MITKDSVTDIASSGEKYLHNNDTIELNLTAIEDVQIMKDKKVIVMLQHFTAYYSLIFFLHHLDMY